MTPASLLVQAKDRLHAHPLGREVTAFVAVGCTAALTHLSMAALLVEYFNLHPLIANVIGFLVAFIVSFSGHSRFTFPIAPKLRAAARWRFFVVACMSFAMNQLGYAALLHLFGERLYLPLLAITILFVAVLTFTASKFWAFAAISR